MTPSSTGIEELDIFLGGGLPRGFTTLLLSPAGAGSEIFAKQFSAGHRGERVIYVSTDESVHEVQDTISAAGWDASNVAVLDLQTDFAEAMLDAQQHGLERPPKEGKRRFDPRELVEGTSSRDLLSRAPRKKEETPSSSRDYLGQLIAPYAKLRPPDRMVVHSLDFFLNLYSIEEAIASLTALKAANARSGGQLLLVLTKGAHGGATERRLELLADCLIELEMTRKGTKFERFFMVKKVKNRTQGVGVSTYEVGATGFSLETLERIV